MKASPLADTLGTNPEPLAFLLHSGAYSSLVLLAKPDGGNDLFASMDADNLWRSDCVQLTESAVFFQRRLGRGEPSTGRMDVFRSRW